MLRPSDWKRLSAGAGTKGPPLDDCCYLELANLTRALAGQDVGTIITAS
jgi:hypothetical protein